MSTVIGDLEILLSATDQGFTAALETAAGKVAQFGQVLTTHKATLGSVGTAVAGLGLGITGLAAVIGGTALKAASDFQTALVTTGNNAGMTASQIQQMGQQILQLSSATGASNKDLLTAYMYIHDMGYKGADAMNLLTTATKEALATNSSVADSASTLATVMHEFNVPVSQAAATMDELHTAAASARMTIQDMVSTFGPVGAQASAMGVPLNQAAAAFAALTRNGFNAAMSATQVRDMLVHIMAPTKAQTAALEALSGGTGGVTLATTKASQQMSNYQAELQIANERIMELTTGTKSHTSSLTTAQNAITRYTSAIALTNTEIDQQRAKIDALNPLNKNYGKDLQSETNRLTTLTNRQTQENTQLDIAKAKITALSTSTGTSNLTLQQAQLRVTELQQKIQDLGLKSGLTKTQVSGLAASGVDLVYDFSAAGLKAKGLVGVLADLKTATGGNAQEMNKLIPNLRGGLGAMVLVGKGSSDLTMILNAEKKSIGSTEQAYAMYSQTTGAQTKRLQQNIQNLWIAIGTGLLPSLNRIVSAITPVVEKFAVWAQQNPKLVDSIIEGVGAFGIFLTVLGTVMKVVSILGPMFSFLGSVIGPVVEAFQAFGAIGGIVTILEGIGGAIAAIIGVLTAPITLIVALGVAIGVLGYLVVTHFTQIKQFVTTALNDAGKAIASFAAAAPALISSAVSTITTFFAALPDKIASSIGFIVGYLTAFATVKIPQFVQNVITFFQQLPTKIQTIMVALLQLEVLGWTEIFDWLKTAVPQALTTVITFFEQLPGRIGKVLETTKDNVWTAIEQIGPYLTSKVSQIIQWGANIGKAFIQGIENALGGLGAMFEKGLAAGTKAVKGNSPPEVGPLKDIDKWGFNVGSAWVGGFTNAINTMNLNLGSLAPALGSSASSVTNSTYNAGNTNTVSMTNTFNVPSSATADNVTSFLALQLEHAGIV